jgi:hypothetical protein
MGLRDTRLDRYIAAAADASSGRAMHDLLAQLSATRRDVEITVLPGASPMDAPPHDQDMAICTLAGRTAAMS